MPSNRRSHEASQQTFYSSPNVAHGPPCSVPPCRRRSSHAASCHRPSGSFRGPGGDETADLAGPTQAVVAAGTQ